MNNDNDHQLTLHVLMYQSIKPPTVPTISVSFKKNMRNTSINPADTLPINQNNPLLKQTSTMDCTVSTHTVTT